MPKGQEKQHTQDGRLRLNRTIKVPLYPTPEQAELFEKTFGCCRYIWNRILADAEEFYAATDKHFLPTPAKYKKEAPFLQEVDSQALCSVHQSLRRAFQNFFQHPDQYGYPSYKRKKAQKNSYTTFCQYLKSGPTLYLVKDGVRLPKIGVVRARLYRKPLHWWVLKSAVVSKTPSGRYFCSLQYEYDEKAPQPAVPTPETTLGLNYSIPHFYVDSNGQTADPPHWLRQSEKKLALMQRRLSRMKPDSKNYQEQRRKIQLLHEHIANQRKDFIHKESRRIANAWNAVCVRESDLREASREIKLGNVMDAGFGRFRLCLQYKLARQGKPYITVGADFPSAKRCHVCGHVNDALTKQDRVWVCPACGTVLRRAENSAINIRAQGLSQLALDGPTPAID